MPANAAPASSRLPHRRILIVDGDTDTVALYREVFVAGGWVVNEASDGREALVQAFAEQPSIVVTELWLAYIDGAALSRLLRRDSLTTKVPILVVTSESRASYLKQAEDAGVNAILMKPSTPNIIVAAVDRLTQVVAPVAFVQPVSRRAALVKTHQRFETTTPNEPAPQLLCPICTGRLIYEKTFFGGVSRRHPERWDHFRCARCGEFSYRQRTRRLRHLA